LCTSLLKHEVHALHTEYILRGITIVYLVELKVILYEQDVSNMLGLPIKRVDTGRDMPIKDKVQKFVTTCPYHNLGLTVSCTGN
jgi:hypothetical protein